MPAMLVMRDKLKDPLSVNLLFAFLVLNKEILFIFTSIGAETSERYLWFKNYFANPFGNPFVPIKIEDINICCRWGYIFLLPVISAGIITFGWPWISNWVDKYLKKMEQDRNNSRAEIEKNIGYEQLIENKNFYLDLSFELIDHIFSLQKIVESQKNIDDTTKKNFEIKLDCINKLNYLKKNDEGFRLEFDSRKSSHLSSKDSYQKLSYKMIEKEKADNLDSD